MKLFLFLLLFFFLPSVLAEQCQENQQQQCGISDVGACTYGIQICQQGQWSICYGNRDPVSEVCDNRLDDDCDGQIDEGCFCAADEERSCSGMTEGICKPGYQTCINGTAWSACFNQTLPLSTDLCDNGLDDDCDGQIDEGCQQNQTQQTTCFNTLQDGDETGVDCGGSCRSCFSCTDGVLNQGEYKTSLDLGNGTLSDCGGPHCPACPTCSDGIQNQGEQDIDCGGPCASCRKDASDPDADGDGLSLSVELRKGTDPLLADSDHDGISDGQDRMPLCPNTVCDSTYGEDTTTCPEDCKSGISLSLVFLVLFFILLAIGGYFYYQFKRGVKEPSSKDNKKAAQEPVYIDKGLLQQSPPKEKKSKVDEDIEVSLKKAEKYFK